MTGRRRSATSLAQFLALLVAVLPILLIAPAGPAAAGGPTSVLLVVPGSGRTASLYTGSADYDGLTRLLLAFDPPRGTSNPRPAPAGAAGVTITWLVHDVQVWRVDRVEFTTPRPTVVTRTTMDGGSIWEVPAVRYTPADGKALTALLDRLGVGPSGVGPSGGASAAPVVAVPAGSVGSVGSVGSGSAGGSGPEPGRGWLWGLAGTALGAVLARAGSVLAVRRRRSSSGSAGVS